MGRRKDITLVTRNEGVGTLSVADSTSRLEEAVDSF